MSEIFVDTIRKTGGTLGTDIRIKNTSVYESDGGTSVTQNLVQGLIKSWVNFNGSGDMTPRDSFNISGIVDNGTGTYTVSFNNDFSNANYATSFAGGDYSGTDDAGHNQYIHTFTTGAITMLTFHYSSGSNVDVTALTSQQSGDLA